MSIFQLVVKGVLSGSTDIRQVHHYEFPQYVPGQTDLQAFVDEWDLNYKTRLQASLGSAYSQNSYGLRRVDLADQPESELVATAGSWLGTNTGDLLPAQTALLATFKAPTAFPRTTRTYLAAFTETSNAGGGQASTGLKTAALGWAGDILTIVVPGQTSAVKVAVQYAVTPRAIAFWNTVLTTSINGVWATQRRRRPGVGS